MPDGYLIGQDFLGRIRRVVDAAEAAPRRMGVPDIPVRLEGDDGDGGGGSAIRLGRISAAWLKGDTATVTRLAGDGSELSPAQTFEAINHFVDISFDCGPRKVACAKVAAFWILIAAECQ